jgi:2-keto-3-deoxy-6-phosphogluconate aldolase
MSYNTILLGDGQVDQLIEAISPDSVETLMQLGVGTPTEAVSLLFVGISMITCILAQILEGLSILQYRAGSLIDCQEFIQLAIKNSSWDVVPFESSIEFLSRNFMTSR